MKSSHLIIIKITMFLIMLFSFTCSSPLLAVSPQNDHLYELKSETKKEQIILQLKAEGSWDYMVFSEDGSCVRMGLLEKGKNKISLKDLCKGSYFVYLSNGKQRFMEKVEQ